MRGEKGSLQENEYRSSVKIQMPFQYIFFDKEDASEVILLMHGYSQSAQSFLHKIKKALPLSAKIIAANGPFPVPERDGDSFKVGFSWYFYDFKTDQYYVDMKPAVEMWKTIVKETRSGNLPKRIIGYSQGGYLSPFVAQELKGVHQVIGLSCQFLDEELTEPFLGRMDAIHGTSDEVVDYEKAKKSHEKLRLRGIKGEFISVEKAGHGLSAPTIEALEGILNH